MKTTSLQTAAGRRAGAFGTLLVSLCLLLVACVAEPVRLTMTTRAIVESVSAGDAVSVNVIGKFTINDTAITPDKVFLALQDNNGNFNAPGAATIGSDNQFTYTLTSLSSLSAGAHSGTLTIRACADAACVQPYPNASATATVTYTINVNPVTEWSGWQRDASHNGNVPITLDPTKFAKAWEWDSGSDLLGAINPVSIGDGHVYITKDIGQGAIYALNEADGSQAWKVSLGLINNVNPPATANGKVFVSVTGLTETNLWTLDAATGAVQFKSPFNAALKNLLTPTVYGDQVFTNGGSLGGDIIAFSAADGSRTWAQHAGNNVMATPAVDANNVYYHSGKNMEVWDRKTGTLVFSLPDPYGKASSLTYFGAPIVGGHKNVISYSGDAYSLGIGSNAEPYTQRVLSSFRTDIKVIEWVTSTTYLTTPALAKGVLYAARNNPMSLDAIDENSGRVLWSWTPSGNGDTEFHRNIIVTNNLLFVSTDRAVYALDLATKTPKWSYPKPGMLALSANRMLYIATGAKASDGRLVAIKLN